MSKQRGEVDDKIEKLFKAFNDFIEKYHGESSEEEDQKIANKWESLKKAIEQDPLDIDSHYQFIQKHFMSIQPQNKGK